MKLQLQNEGTIVLLQPMDDAADSWLAENLSDDGMKWGTAYVVEPRYVPDIVEGFQAEGGEVA